MALFAELRRRNVFKVALLYAVACWLIVWFVDVDQAEVTVRKLRRRNSANKAIAAS